MRSIRHVIPTTLGDSLVLHESPPDPLSAPIARDVILLHGMGGSHASPYMVRIARTLSRAGYRVWRLDQRGCGAGIGLARNHAHAGRTEDLQATLDWVATRDCQDHPVTVVGFSLGANLLLKWLAARDTRHLNPKDDESVSSAPAGRVDSAIAFAPPVDLITAVQELRRGLGRFYDQYFCQRLLNHLRERRRMLPSVAVRPTSSTPRRLIEFDAQFTAPLGGFRDVHDYYTRSSSVDDLNSIRTPTLIVADTEDPVIPYSVFDKATFGPGIRFISTCGGGHLGYIQHQSSDDDARYWMDHSVVNWIGSLPGNVNGTSSSP